MHLLRCIWSRGHAPPSLLPVTLSLTNGNVRPGRSANGTPGRGVVLSDINDVMVQFSLLLQVERSCGSGSMKNNPAISAELIQARISVSDKSMMSEITWPPLSSRDQANKRVLTLLENIILKLCKSLWKIFYIIFYLVPLYFSIYIFCFVCVSIISINKIIILYLLCLYYYCVYLFLLLVIFIIISFVFLWYNIYFAVVLFYWLIWFTVIIITFFNLYKYYCDIILNQANFFWHFFIL